MSTIEQITAEEATGCAENPHGLGETYAGPINRKGMVSNPGHVLDTEEARYDYLREGGCVGIPNAGAGSYRSAFRLCGFTEIEAWDTGSSAGDWTFMVKDGEGGDWYPAFQNNRYPYHGFEYVVDFQRGWETKEQLIHYMES